MRRTLCDEAGLHGLTEFTQTDAKTKYIVTILQVYNGIGSIGI